MRIVAGFVALAIHEYLPAFGRGAVAPRIDAQRTIVAVKVARGSIALLVAAFIVGLSPAVVFNTLLTLALPIHIVQAFGRIAEHSARKI